MGYEPKNQAIIINLPCEINGKATGKSIIESTFDQQRINFRQIINNEPCEINIRRL